VNDALRYECRTVHFRGHVQGVGFRYSVQHIAEPFAVTGYVQNLADGRVRMVVEGTADDLDNLLAEVELRLQRHIQDIDLTTSDATGEFDGFQIKR